MRVYRVRISISFDGVVSDRMESGDIVDIAGVTYVSQYAGSLLEKRDSAWFPDINAAKLAAALKIQGIADEAMKVAERLRDEVHRA